MQLPDRLEAPCVLSPRGRLLLVGCHDGYLYALCAAHGAQRWPNPNPNPNPSPNPNPNWNEVRLEELEKVA